MESTISSLTKIIGTGSSTPVRPVGNAEVASRLKIEEGYISRMSGIQTRYWANEHEDCSLLAEKAARRAMESAMVDPQQIDMILVSTTSPEMVFPSTACLLQKRLGLRRAGALDVSASCTGFLYGLSMADRFIRSGQFHRCLVVAAEVKSRYLNYSDSGTSILFGDGAGAAVVARGEGENSGILQIRLFSDGKYADLIKIPAGGSRLPASSETVSQNLHTLQLRGKAIFRLAVKRLSLAIREVCEEEKMPLDEVSQFIFHQANGRLLNQLAVRLGIKKQRLFSIIGKYGNTSSASLPIALDCANRQGCLHSGDVIVLGTFGGGLTWGTALIRWG